MLAGQVAVVDEALAEVMEGVAAPRAAPAVLLQGIEFSGAAFGAESLMVFPAELQQIFFRRIFIFYYFFKCLEIHI